MGIDKLTGLYNFDRFLEIADEKLFHMGGEQNYVYVSVDISNFKYINRIYGFDKGNHLIQVMADLLTKNNEKLLLACRPYSDHIVAVYEATQGFEYFSKWLNDVQNNFMMSQKADFADVSLHLNIGVYVSDNSDDTITVGIDKANIARRNAKGNFTVPFTIYTTLIKNQSLDEVRVISLFERALENDSILIYLQPKVNVERQEVVGAEALTRLLDEDGQIVPPNVFIPVLEKSGKILDLDWYVLKNIFKKIHTWLADGVQPKPVSVNLSKLHFYHESFATDLIDACKEYDIPAELIELEVTESVFFDETELLISKIEEFRDYGFKVSVDDFGTGYASFNMIATLPVDVIKLDKGFVDNSISNEKGQKIVKGLISILNDIDVGVICEGIETKEEESIVYACGCDEVQGFLHNKPIPIDEFERIYLMNKN